MVEVRLSIPFSGTHRTHAARAELLAATLLAGTPRRNRLEIDRTLATVGGDLYAGVDPERDAGAGVADAHHHVLACGGLLGPRWLTENDVRRFNG